MTTQLYLVPLPDAQTSDPPQQGVSANVSVQGLLEEAGVATNRIAAENIDLSITGRYALGPQFSKVLERELNSIAKANGYGAFPLYDGATADIRDEVGYYEVSSATVNPAHKATENAYQYTVDLADVGTHEEYWRTTKTNGEPIETSLATGSRGLIGLPAAASKVRWFDTGAGSEGATVQTTVAAELGDVDLYDPAEPSFDNPTLIFELPYEAEGDVDVRVWDDRGLSKYATLDDGTEIRQWAHAYHTGFEFEGRPIVDNGLLRVTFDEDNGVIAASEWNDSGGSWDSVAIDHGDWTLFDADIEAINPAEVTVYSEWENTSTGTINAIVLAFHRGVDGVIVRHPDGESAPSSLVDVFSAIASNQTTDPNPTQGVEPRGEVK